MPFDFTWFTLLDRLDEHSTRATFAVPLTTDRFVVTDVQVHQIGIRMCGSGDSRILQRDQFESLYRRIRESSDGLNLERLSPDAGPYIAILSIHPRFEINEYDRVIQETDEDTIKN